MKYNRAETVDVEVISLEDAPKGCGAFGHGALRKFLVAPHSLLRKAS